MQILQSRSLFYSFIWVTSCKCQQEKITNQEKITQQENMGMDLYWPIIQMKNHVNTSNFVPFVHEKTYLKWKILK